MHLVGFTLEVYYDALSYQRQNSQKQTLKKKKKKKNNKEKKKTKK